MDSSPIEAGLITGKSLKNPAVKGNRFLPQ
jgi:hypothetical protein